MLKLLEAQTYLVFIESQDGGKLDTYVSPLRVDLRHLENWVAELQKSFPGGGVIVFDYDRTGPSK